MSNDGLIDSFQSLRAKHWYRGPNLASLDERGRRLYFRSADLAARLCLNGEALRLFDDGNKRGSCMLTHAERYLADRLAYELAPWPKGMLKLEPDDAYALPGERREEQHGE
jgi:hypothetical protein